MTTRPSEHCHYFRALVLVLCGQLAYLPAQGNAETAPDQRALTAETREAIRGVGHALLQAKRAYVPPDTTALRDNVQRVRRLVVSLARPVNSVTPIQIAKPGAATRQASVAPTDWRQARARDIQQLSAATGGLRRQCQALRTQITS